MIYFTSVYQSLTNFANSVSFHTDLELIFGNNFNQTIAQQIKNQWLNQDFSNLPAIQIISSDILGNALGGYASSNNTIYLSENFVANATKAQIDSVLLEEIGHYIDAQINTVDTEGDEGQLFSYLVRGITLSETQLNLIRQENDRQTITINGEEITIEMATDIIINSGNSISESINNITVTGTGTTGIDSNSGVVLESSGFIESTGIATITVTGNGAPDSTGFGNIGISINGSGSEIRSVDGAIELTGTGGNGTSSNYGIGLFNGGKISSTGKATINIVGNASSIVNKY